MEWIYNVNRRMIREINNSEEIDLTECESRFIEVLCNGLLNTYDEINDYVYKYSGYPNKFHHDKKHYNNAISIIKTRLLKKINMNIRVIKARGMRLYDQIYIE